jgi:hypothetical protein
MEDRVILNRVYGDNKDVETDVTDLSFVEIMALLKEEMKTSMTVRVQALGVNLVVDNYKFFGRIEKSKKK